MQKFYWKTDDGKKYFADAWVRESCRGVLVCVHGMGGAGEQFLPLGDKLREFSVYAQNLRGQGLDHITSQRGATLNVIQQHRDITVFLSAIRAQHPHKPIFLIGESMGALLSASYVAGYPNVEIQGLIMAVPVVELARPVPNLLKQIIRRLANLFPRMKLHPALFVNNTAKMLPLTRDRDYQELLQKKPFYLRTFTLKFLSELGDLIDASSKLTRSIQKSCLVLAAGQDCFVKVHQIQTWFDQIAAIDKSIRIYPEAYHLLWHDWDRDQVLADIEAWLCERL